MRSRVIKFSIAAACLLFTAFFFGKPSIHFESLEHDFGEVQENSEQTCEFLFYNKGKATLVIEQVDAG